MTQRETQPERRATLRIDDAAGYKAFQGVWLEHADGTRWVVAYRPRDVWRWFADREVVVTGHCYMPEGQAISSTHFRVESLRTAHEELGRGPYLSVGPERVMRGQLLLSSGGAGTKMAGATTPVFVADDGRTYVVANEKAPTREGRVAIRARIVEPDMTYTARTTGPDVWIASVHDEDYVDPSATSQGGCP